MYLFIYQFTYLALLIEFGLVLSGHQLVAASATGARFILDKIVEKHFGGALHLHFESEPDMMTTTRWVVCFCASVGSIVRP